jgi:hypothetical protein
LFSTPISEEANATSSPSLSAATFSGNLQQQQQQQQRKKKNSSSSSRLLSKWVCNTSGLIRAGMTC